MIHATLLLARNKKNSIVNGSESERVHAITVGLQTIGAMSIERIQ